MDMPENIRAWNQKALRDMAVDDGSCFHFVARHIESVERRSAALWQFGVDNIYRCLRSGLILVHNYAGCADEASFLKAIRTFSPFKSEGGLLWNGTLLYGSDLLLSLSERYGLSDPRYAQAINQNFTNEIERRFEAAGVPWSDAPLLPLTPAPGEA